MPELARRRSRHTADSLSLNYRNRVYIADSQPAQVQTTPITLCKADIAERCYYMV